VFDPRGYEYYKSEYPELNQIEQFRALRDKELKLVWYLSCPSSPLVEKFGTDLKKKLPELFGVIFKNKFEQNFVNQFPDNIPENILVAMERMSKLDVSTRGQAKEMVDDIFSNYKTILSLPADSFKDSQGNTDYNKYISVRKLIRAELSDIIKQKEEGFGIKDKGKKVNDNEGQDSMSEFHKNYKED
jgi:hypothetical protein